VNEELRAELARLLHEEATDPRVRGVTLTRVDVSPDLRNATIWWSRIGADEGEAAETVEAGLARAASFLRRRLAEELTTRRVPALRFRHDLSLARGAETLELLRSIRHDEE
jgi:ribosome-binding factor A